MCILRVMRKALLGFFLLAACTPSHPKTPATAKPLAQMLEGLGDWRHPITTRSTEAQAFFDQGLKLIYGFNHGEAILAFQEAARLDPDAAMPYWGIALALGPNYNLPTDPESEKLAREMIAKARAAKEATPLEKEYVEAAARRYAGEPNPDRRALDRDYADAMREVAKKHPEDVDAQVLFAESMMDLRPWLLWDHDGNPAPGTEEILATLERVLAKHPDHPGANHYYVHAQEAGPHPEKAKACADRLPSLMPGAGHIVHMPSHIYIHTAQWKDASDANVKAIAADKAYLAKPHAEGAYSMMYVAHNFQFLWATASMEGRSAVAIQAATEMTKAFDEKMVREMSKTMPGMDYLLAPPLVARVRFGKWDEILAATPPPADFKYLGAMSHFARALAFARTKKMEDARREQQALAQFVIALKDEEMLGPLNSAKTTFAVATKLLAGELEAADGHAENAIALEREAVELEDALNYDEPPAWPLPTRQYLGALLLENRQPIAATRIYEEDLKKNPENGWALFGLKSAYKARFLNSVRKDPPQEKEKDVRAIAPEDTAKLEERFKSAWSRADVTLSASRY